MEHVMTPVAKFVATMIFPVELCKKAVVKNSKGRFTM
jgi:hypothetical protein